MWWSVHLRSSFLLLGLGSSLSFVACQAPVGGAELASSTSNVVRRDDGDGDIAGDEPYEDGPFDKDARDETFESSDALSDDTSASTDDDDAPPSVMITWNRVSSKAEYSLDLILENGDVIAPCVDVRTLRQKLSYRFDGSCVSPDIEVSMDDVRNFRICSAEDDRWERAKCVDGHWDRRSQSTTIRLP